MQAPPGLKLRKAIQENPKSLVAHTIVAEIHLPSLTFMKLDAELPQAGFPN